MKTEPYYAVLLLFLILVGQYKSISGFGKNIICDTTACMYVHMYLNAFTVTEACHVNEDGAVLCLLS